MAKGVDWFAALDFPRALSNIKAEMSGDWYRDPWLWPELDYLADKGKNLLVEFLAGDSASPYALLDVPKENWGTRPAVVINPLDRLCYQALVDRASVDLIGAMTPNAFGWRLSASDPKRGIYSHNTKQWEFYRDHLSRLADSHEVVLRSDLASFFASIRIPLVQEEIDARCAQTAPTKRLVALLSHFEKMPNRSGLPQRSTASAVLANAIARSLDDVLIHHSSTVPATPEQKVSYRSFARWMDDMWLFIEEESAARAAQVELQSTAMRIGLNLNSAKTELLAGDRVQIEAKEIEHSAIESALFFKRDHQPLEELIDKIMLEPERAARPSVRFATHRMVQHGSNYRIHELAENAKRMPHVADALADLFGAVLPMSRSKSGSSSMLKASGPSLSGRSRTTRLSSVKRYSLCRRPLDISSRRSLRLSGRFRSLRLPAVVSPNGRLTARGQSSVLLLRRPLTLPSDGYSLLRRSTLAKPALSYAHGLTSTTAM